MDILTLAREFQQAADLVYTDRDDRGVLLIESHRNPKFEVEYFGELRRDQVRFDFPFALFVNSDWIYLLGPDRAGDPIARFETATTLEGYWLRGSESRPIAERDLVFATGRWLDDLAADPPPGGTPHRVHLAEIGLVDRLRGGFRHSKTMLLQKNSWSEPLH